MFLRGCWYHKCFWYRKCVLRGVIGYDESVIECETCKAQQEIRRKQTRYERLQEEMIGERTWAAALFPKQPPGRRAPRECLVRKLLQTAAADFTCACSLIPSGRWTAHRTAQQVHTSMYSDRYGVSEQVLQEL